MPSANRLITVGDGFCHNHYWPMWSQLLAEILNCPWVNYSRPGLGNEALANIVLDGLDDAHNDDLWVIQWAAPRRLDLRIDNANADIITSISRDPVYYDNFIQTKKNKVYWCSGASSLPMVSEHTSLLTEEQQVDRSRLFQLAVLHKLKEKNVKWKFIFTYSSTWSLPTPNTVTESMEDFSKHSKYRCYDVGEIQPVSSIHLDFLETHILPGLDYNYLHLEQIREKTIADDQRRKNHNLHQPLHTNHINRNRELL